LTPRHEIVERKLAALAGYVEELRPKARLTLAAYRRGATARRAVERLLQLCTDAAADACAGLLAAAGRIPASNLRAQFTEAAALGALPADLAERLLAAAGLRNRLVHDYDRLDDARVLAAARSALTDFPRFIAAVAEYLAREEVR
jgi:uncharacterized protein YutE (UPF0331/DUF86 family)